MNTEINPNPWCHTTDDDFHLLDNLSNISNRSLMKINTQKNNNSLHLISAVDEKQLMGPLGSNL